MADRLEVAQARAWLHAVNAPDIDARERKLDGAEENLNIVELMSFDDERSAEEHAELEREVARWAGEVEWLRDEMVTQWQIRDESQLSPETRRAGEVAQARAWLGEVDPAMAKQWSLTRDYAVTRDEASADEDRLVSLWQASNGRDDAAHEARSVFDTELSAERDARTERVRKAQVWLKATDPSGHFAYKESRAMADFPADAVGDDTRLVQHWLKETGGELTPEQLRAETSALEQAGQGLRQRMTQRVRAWVSPPQAEATRESGTGLEL